MYSPPAMSQLAFTSLLCFQLFAGAAEFTAVDRQLSEARVTRVWSEILPQALEHLRINSKNFSRPVEPFTAQDLAILASIHKNLAAEHLRFESDLAVVDYSTYRGAVTGTYVGMPVYVDPAMVRTATEAQVLSLLLHELSHHHGLLRDDAANELGTKLSRAFTAELRTSRRKNLVLTHFPGAKGKSIARLSDGVSSLDLRNGLGQALWERVVDVAAERAAILRDAQMRPSNYPHRRTGLFGKMKIIDVGSIHFPHKPWIQVLREKYQHEFAPRVTALRMGKPSEPNHDGVRTIDFVMDVAREFSNQCAEPFTVQEWVSTTFQVSVDVKEQKDGSMRIITNTPVFRRISEHEERRANIVAQAAPVFSRPQSVKPGDVWRVVLELPVTETGRDFQVQGAKLKSSRLNWAKGLDVEELNFTSVRSQVVERGGEWIHEVTLEYAVPQNAPHAELSFSHLETNRGAVPAEVDLRVACGAYGEKGREFSRLSLIDADGNAVANPAKVELPYGKSGAALVLELTDADAGRDPWVRVDLSYTSFANSAETPQEVGSIYKSSGTGIEKSQMHSYVLGHSYYLGEGLSSGEVRVSAENGKLRLDFSGFWQGEDYIPIHPNLDFPALKLLAVRVLTQSGDSIVYQFEGAGLEIWKVDDGAERFSRYWNAFSH